MAGASDRRRRGDFAEDGGSSRGGTSAGDSDELMYNHGVGVAGDVSETDVSDEGADEERGVGSRGLAYGTCGAATTRRLPLVAKTGASDDERRAFRARLVGRDIFARTQFRETASQPVASVTPH